MGCITNTERIILSHVLPRLGLFAFVLNIVYIVINVLDTLILPAERGGGDINTNKAKLTTQRAIY